jgi:O-antigen/teichoic acid export membrane protein
MMNLETQAASDIPGTGTSQAAKKHLRGSTLLFVGRLISMAANFVIQVLIVRYLSKNDFGAFAYGLSIVSLGTQFILLGLDKTITRFVPIYQEQNNYNKVFGAILLMAGTIASLGLSLILLVYGLRDWLGRTVVMDPLALSLLVLVIALVPVRAFDQLFLGLFTIFSNPRAIFFRKYLMAPGLQLAVVILLVFGQSDVFFLASGYVIAGILGIIFYLVLLLQTFHRQGLFQHFALRRVQMPVREIFGFSLPLMMSSSVHIVRGALVILFLEHFHPTSEVANFRAVLPVGELNMVVYQSFTALFMPSAARMFARKEWSGINDFYWQTAIWIAVLSFPIFMLTFALAQPMTILLFGERYADAALVLALLSLGYYFNAGLGFNNYTLRVFGKVRYIFLVDLFVTVVTVVVYWILIPRYGAIGAALATSGTLMAQNLLYQFGLKWQTDVHFFQKRYRRVYLTILAGVTTMVLIRVFFTPPIYVDLGVAALISLVVLRINHRALNVRETFPEILRFPFVRWFFDSTSKQSGDEMNSDANISKHGTSAVFFEDHIRQHAIRYFPGIVGQDVSVRFVDGRRYRHSQFYRFDVIASGNAFRALVKTPPLRAPVKEPPKLGPRIEPSVKFEAQYEAMSKIHEYFTVLADPRFGTVRPMDKVAEHQAIIMEEVPAPSLRHLVQQTSRLRNPLRATVPDNLALVFRNAGAWLSKFHAMPAVQPVKVTHNGQRLDFITTIDKLADYLIKADPKNAFLQQIAAKTKQDAMQLLPDHLPLGLRHGDYGLSNILAGQDGKVTVLDTPAICCSPIYEDLAYMLVGLKAKWSQVLSLNVAYDSRQLALHEQEFLFGYFGPSPIPYKIIRLYEVQALLVRWSRRVFALKEQSLVKNRVWKEVQLRLMRRFFGSMLRELTCE